LEGDRLLIQWRMSRTIKRVGLEVRSESELVPVREVTIPISAIGAIHVGWSWSRWPPGTYLTITAADLRAFESLAGKDGLELKHPAEFAVRVRRIGRIPARLFASEVSLVLADRALASATAADQLPPPA
jgi:hypothetical protein